MRLHALRLQNFRQHADTRLTFDVGLTGIIGPNGSGKSTILEAIAWALYGASAARGNRDGIRNMRAEGRAPVRVELDFELAGHRYRVVRGLTTAECYLDGGEQPIASTLSGVSELLQRRLGMTRAEFFHTYFTEQKELDVMASLSAPERARFLTRVLGYDRLTQAQQLVKEQRRALVNEATGVRKGLADADAVRARWQEATQRVQGARVHAAEVHAAQRVAADALAAVAPQWLAAEAERERMRQHEAERAALEATVAQQTQELARAEQVVAEIVAARDARAPLVEAIASLPAQRTVLAAQDALAAAIAHREGLAERLRGIAEELQQLEERAAKLEAAPALEVSAVEQIAAHKHALTALEEQTADARTSWARDRQEAETRLEALRTQYADLVQQRERLQGLGAESPCPTCGRPLGASYQAVLDLLVAQVETVQADGQYYRQRVEQLAAVPAHVVALDEQRKAAQVELATLERRLGKIQEAMRERAQLEEARTRQRERRAAAQQELDALPAGHDAAQHAAVRAEVARLTEIERRVATLDGVLLREHAEVAARDRITAALVKARQRLLELEGMATAPALSEDAFAALRETHTRARETAHRLELESARAVGEVERAAADVAAADAMVQHLATLEAALADLERNRLVHEELDRTLQDLRTDLTTQLRPELAEVASRFLDVLTDGRYNALEFDDEYAALVLEDGLPKPVISGGEEDLCNLVLRLAISQMIAERAGQAFSLLILDEVFGSLDDARRGNVVELLRRLHDRFEQVIVITHIEQVREGLDRVLVVRFDEDKGTSTVTAGTGGAGRTSDYAEAPDTEAAA